MVSNIHKLETQRNVGSHYLKLDNSMYRPLIVIVR